MPRKVRYFTKQEQKEADAARKQKSKNLETETQCQQRLENNNNAQQQQIQNTSHKHHANSSQLRNLVYGFSKDKSSYPIPHKVDVVNYANCTYCNALKLPMEIHKMCCSNGKVALAELDTLNELYYQTNAISNSNLNMKTIQALKARLDQVNPYVATFHHISSLPVENIKNLTVQLHTNISGLDQRTHNAPTASQVAAIWIDNDVPNEMVQKRDIILYMSMD
ncbi:10424_t:CDS:2 [Cetraspora pellucida]|uniref:10424_t:CDS:1 n=1 Tax=Cetraspora pellucida TaxID=1433469 RepID=A0A9N9NMN8_9GLOM|nr:10424_t:CDS:2 [Cetraspora pellucida]